MMFNGNKVRSGIAQLSAGLLVMSFTACTSNHSSDSSREGIDPQPAASAAANIKDSLGSAKAASALADLSPGDQDQVLIQKSALDKEFLFSGSAIPQTNAATSSGLVGRVVTFKREGKKVFMLEATQGQVVSPTLPSTLILAAFPILNETSSALVIDFNQGMSQVFTDSGMYASDDAGLGYQPARTAQAIRRSYLESVQTLDNILEVRQAAQVAEPAPVPAGTPPGTPTSMAFNSYEFRYYLQPYHPNPNFKPLEVNAQTFEHVGFFEVNPVIEPVTGRSVTRVTMRDMSKPVVYAISANTPAQYHDSIRDGILYWNKVFGREVVQAIDAPAGVTAPDPRYNIIQWVENDSAGFAYADVLTDPRSGEILHSQVYLTSVFGVATSQNMPSYGREYPQTSSGLFSKGLFASSRVCERGVDPDAASAIVALKAQAPVDPAMTSRIVNNYVQFVVTHEVGHTLGLRHNFAGSLASTASPDATDQMFTDYLYKGTLPAQGQIFSSSVMDYNVLSEDVLHVSMFNARNLVLPYDQMAIDWAYAGKAIDTSSALPPFCTDTQAGTISDCLTFDRGAKPIIANEQAINKSLRLEGYSLVESYIKARAPVDPRDAMDFAQVPLDPDAMVKTLITSLLQQVSWFKSSGNQSIVIMNQFPFLTDFYNSDITSAEDASVIEQVKEAGGIDSVLLPLMAGKLDPSKSIAASASSALSTYLQRADVKNGTGPNGKAYSFSDADIALIKTNGQKYFQEVEDRAFDMSMAALVRGPYTNDKLAPDAEKLLGDTAAKIILSMTQKVVAPAQVAAAPSPKPTPSGSPVAATSPVPAASAAPSAPAYAFTYTDAERLAAVNLLNQSLGGKSAEWSTSARSEIMSQLLAYVTAVVGSSLDSVDPMKLSPELRAWYLEQQNIMEHIALTAQQ